MPKAENAAKFPAIATHRISIIVGIDGAAPQIFAAVPDRAAKLQRSFGATVRAERLARRLTQQELAFASQLSLTYVGEIERGQRMVSLDTLVKVAAALNMSARELLEKAEL